MTQDEIIEMLRSSCDKDRVDPEQNGFWVIVTSELEAFAKLVADVATAKEREACAKICDRKDEAWKKAGLWNQSFEYKECAAAIRARGKAND